jgi:hypothetical protein
MPSTAERHLIRDTPRGRHAVPQSHLDGCTASELLWLPNGRLELDGRWEPRQPCTAASREGAVEVVS